jgi:hypothetical protein
MPHKCKFSENDEKCSTQASYGSPTDRKVMFCKLHKAADHIDLRSQKCQWVEKGERCTVQATYGSENDKKKLFCKEHKREIDIDLKSQKCDYMFEEGKTCYRQARFKSSENMRCGEHRLENSQQMRNKLCSFIDPKTNEKCDVIASFGLKNRNLCSKHKSKSDKSFAGYTCKQCLITEAHYGQDKKRDYCAPCFAELHPDSVQGRIYLFKQKTIVEFLKKHFTLSSVDKIIKGGKSKRRPDIVIDCGNFVIVIEIDELQHNNGKYNPHLDKTRNCEIYEDLGLRPIVFIRFNPDSYSVGFKKFKGCFSSKNEINEEIFNNRMYVLVSRIENFKTHGIKADEKIMVEYLYYNR